MLSHRVQIVEHLFNRHHRSCFVLMLWRNHGRIDPCRLGVSKKSYKFGGNSLVVLRYLERSSACCMALITCSACW